MPKNKVMLGSEHPLCDKAQPTMLILFFVVWSVDTLSYFLSGVLTILTGLTAFLLLLFPAILSLAFGTCLALKSHEAVFPETAGQPRLIESGVYSWVRHHTYLNSSVLFGIFLCNGFTSLFRSPNCVFCFL
jgi:protein-S-isoprenylcysteine O-methyltransferase Ste14